MKVKKINKVKTGWKLPLLPLPVCLLGTQVDDKPNFNTIIWFNMIHDNPPLIGIAMRRTHYTNKGVKQSQCFSVNIPTSDMVVVADYCGLHSGSKVDKSKEFDLFYGELKKAPMIMQCCINVECKLVNTIEFKYNDFFVGEIIEIYSDEEYVKNKKPNAKNFDSFICLMPNGPYFKMGEYLAEAYEVGTSYKPKK